MTNQLEKFVGIYMQEHGQKFVFFIKESNLFLNFDGKLVPLSKIDEEENTFLINAEKTKIKFNSSNQGFFHFIDIHYIDRHTIAVRQFPRGKLDELLDFNGKDIFALAVSITLVVVILFSLSMALKYRLFSR